MIMMHATQDVFLGAYPTGWSARGGCFGCGDVGVEDEELVCVDWDAGGEGG
jgi:hypothetical protein